MGFRNRGVAARHKTATFSVSTKTIIRPAWASMRFGGRKMYTRLPSRVSPRRNVNWPFFVFFLFFLATKKKAVLRRAAT